MLIAAVSDTHIPDKARALPAALIEALRTVDLILHAGDLTSQEVLEFLRTLAPTQAVRGNVDEPLLRATLPATRVVEAGGFRLGLVHGDGPGGGTTLDRAFRTFDRVDCIIFGHSHQSLVQRLGPMLMVNPGSPTDRRRAPRPSFALLRTGDQISAEIVCL